MRTIEEIKAEYNKVKNMLPEGTTNTDLCELEFELRQALTKDIPLDRLEEICKAERDRRCVVLPCGVDLMKIYNELTSVREGDEVENYTNGYISGHKNGQIELIRKILNISDGVSHEPEQALKGGASK